MVLKVISLREGLYISLQFMTVAAHLYPVLGDAWAGRGMLPPLMKVELLITGIPAYSFASLEA